MLSLGLTCAVGQLFRPNRSLRRIIPFRSPILEAPLYISTLQRLSRLHRLHSLSKFHSSSSDPSIITKASRFSVLMEEKTNSEQKLYTRMRLWELPDQYIIEPTDGTFDSYLAISRMDGSLNLIEDLPHSSSVRAPKIRTIFGVIGMLRLVAGAYVVVITERECVGSYLGHPIFRASSLQILPCNQSLRSSSAEQKKLETQFSVLLNAAERASGLYFSYDVNLTLRINSGVVYAPKAVRGEVGLRAQRLHDLGNESKLLPLWRQADPRYLWNNYMLEVLIEKKLDPYLLPVVQGSFQYFQAAIGKDIIDVTLIARRCTRRTGTRMWRRGADPDGYVANFVETEQIMHSKGYTASFVQVRGSIPILWEQIVDLTYKPKFEIVRPEEGPRVAERHFLDLRKRYGSVLAVDLINTHGNEGRLREKFANAMQSIFSDDIRYVHFDFHQICGHIHFDRLSFLYDQIADFLKKNGYFMLNTNGEKVKEQLGIVRTNCIDCLDRTNATQSMIGRKMLESQLQQIGIFEADETIGTHPNFDESFKILWANHGDDISLQYSGTPALKRDLVRYGKQTVPGLLMDGWNAMSRYYLNNFIDGTKQDAIDLIHGHYIVSVNRDTTSPSQTESLDPVVSLSVASAIVLAGVIFATMSLRQARYDLRHLLLSAVFAGVSFSIASFVKANGRKFCNRPRLNKPRS